MKRLLGTLVVLIALLIALLAVMRAMPRRISTTEPLIQMTTATIVEATSTYSINVKYPIFGISAVDEKIKAAADAAVTAIKAAPPNPPDMASPQNELTGTFDSVYVGPDIVSVELLLSEYTGGAHPNTAIVAVNVDRKTGKDITLDDALKLVHRNLSQVSEQSLAQLKTRLGDSIFAEGAKALPENYATFLIDAHSVTFVFQSYQVAAYAAGPQEISFPRVQ